MNVVLRTWVHDGQRVAQVTAEHQQQPGQAQCCTTCRQKRHTACRFKTTLRTASLALFGHHLLPRLHLLLRTPHAVTHVHVHVTHSGSPLHRFDRPPPPLPRITLAWPAGARGKPEPGRSQAEARGYGDLKEGPVIEMQVIGRCPTDGQTDTQKDTQTDTEKDTQDRQAGTHASQKLTDSHLETDTHMQIRTQSH